MSKRIYASDEGAGLLSSQPAGRIATAGLGPVGRVPIGNNMEIRSVKYGTTSIYSSSGRAVIVPAAPTDDESPSDDTPANA
jgi:hypothetical protein